jgi:hypothetical protein
MLAIIGGNPARFARLSELFRQATAQAGHAALPIGVHSPGHVAATDERAREEYWPTYQTFLLDTRRQRGFPEITREYFEHEVEYGSLYVGSPGTVARRMVKTSSQLTQPGSSLPQNLDSAALAGAPSSTRPAGVPRMCNARACGLGHEASALPEYPCC